MKSLSCVRLLATPWTAAYQAPPSIGFSRKNTGVGCHCLLWIHLATHPQLHLAIPLFPAWLLCWKNLQFSISLFCPLCLVAQSYPILGDPRDCSPPGSSVHGIFQEEYWSGLPFPSPGDLPDPGIKPGSSTLQVDFLLSEQPEKLRLGIYPEPYSSWTYNGNGFCLNYSLMITVFQDFTQSEDQRHLDNC